MPGFDGSLPALIRKLAVSLAVTTLLFAGVLVLVGTSALADASVMRALFVCAMGATMGLLILDTPVWFGFGSPGFRRAVSWVIGLSVVAIALTVFIAVASNGGV